MDVLALILAFGATARLTRLVTTDAFPPSIRLRGWLWVTGYNRANQDDAAEPPQTAAGHWWPYQLATCPWCLSFWIGLTACTVARLEPDAWWFLIPAAALTASHLAGLASRLD